MELTNPMRDALGDVMNGYIAHAKQPTWATLWHQPSTREPDVVRLIAVMDNPKTLKEMRKEQDAIVSKMKSQPETSGMRLFIEMIPTNEFHLRYQTQSGYELLREWNGDNANLKRPTQILNLFKHGKPTKVLLPVAIAAMLFFLIKVISQHGL